MDLTSSPRLALVKRGPRCRPMDLASVQHCGPAHDEACLSMLFRSASRGGVDGLRVQSSSHGTHPSTVSISDAAHDHTGAR